MIYGSLGVLEIFQGIHDIKTFHINTKALFAFFCCADICSGGTEAMGIKLLVPCMNQGSCTTVYAILVFFLDNHSELKKKRKCYSHLRISLMK